MVLIGILIVAADVGAFSPYRPVDLSPSLFRPVPPTLAWTPTPEAQTPSPSVSVDPTGAAPSPTPTETAAPPSAAQPEAVGELMVTATWYCKPGSSRCTRGYPASGLYAAISPDLKRLRGRTIEVCRVDGGRCVRVKVIDCNCGARKAIDLYASAFEQLAPLSQGRISVVIR